MIALEDFFMNLISSLHLEPSRMRFHNQAVIDAMEVLSEERETIIILERHNQSHIRKKNDIILFYELFFLYTSRNVKSTVTRSYINRISIVYKS